MGKLNMFLCFLIPVSKKIILKFCHLHEQVERASQGKSPKQHLFPRTSINTSSKKFMRINKMIIEGNLETYMLIKLQHYLV